MLRALPRSYQVTPNTPTGDERHNKRKSGHHGRQPQRESARRPVGTLPSAPDVTERIETASLEGVARRTAMIVRDALSLLDNPNGPRVEQRLSPARVRHAAMHPRSARRRRVNRERAADSGDAVAHIRDPRTDLRIGRVKPRA